MRLHHLGLTAFGPFAGAEEVDFDELCDAGLFLLTGPTGAGKTTILDAVCFALYGTVPGDRGVKVLKSQHADPAARPEVVLDFSVRGRRFTLRRTPEWSRPKRRGTGTTTENATATLVETTGGEEHLLSSRAQEVGHLVGQLVGMQSTQFVQVAMLPQGGFARFLRASSQERHGVLQHLFRTDRFARIEDWVHDHSRTLGERSATGERAVERLLDALADRSGTELPEALVGTGLRDRDAPDQARAWADEVLHAARATEQESLGRHRAAAHAVTEARAAHQRAVRGCELVVRREGARAALDRLARTKAEADRAGGRLVADEKARRAAPVLRLLDDAHHEVEATRAAWSRAAAALRRERSQVLWGPDGPGPELSVAELTELEQKLRDRAGRWEALLPREQELARAREAVETSGAELDAVTAEHRATLARRAEIPGALERAEARRAALDAEARRGERLELELGQAVHQLEAALGADRCAADLVELEDRERRARDRAADARERVQDLTERRLAGMAAELAGRLESGKSCQVCGSTEHPSPAEPGSDVVTEAEQVDADTAHEAAHRAHTEAAGRVIRARERLEALRDRAGDLRPAEAQHRVDTQRAALETARHAAADLAGAERTVADLTSEERELTATVHELATRVATLAQARESHRSTVASIVAELRAELGDTAGPVGGMAVLDATTPLATRIDELRAACAEVDAARETLRRHDAASERGADLQRYAADAAAEHGFGDVDSMRTAKLADEERVRLEALLEARATEATRARAVLDDPEVAAVADMTPADPEGTAAELERAELREAEHARSFHQAAEAVTAIVRHRDGLVKALEEWAPSREEYLRADSMSRLVRGMGGDNHLQMRLSAYVLATRLDQVVAAANERLGHMRDQRYLLQRTGRAARKGAQAGLGLEVVDQWTGDVRDPATLSGGETFVVALSLALGLADVVTHEAGGAEVETLFVDEGFGSLDADTLDDVMDRLDDLRAGGRAVGVVSHVSELRNRIPTQLHVDKQRNGSTIALRTLVA